MATMNFGSIPKNLQSAKWMNASACVHRRFVKKSGAGIDYATADTDVILGILYSDGVAQNGYVDYIPLVWGETYLVDCGAAGIVDGAFVGATTDGEAVTVAAGAGHFTAGIAKGAATAAKVMTLLACPTCIGA